MFACGRSVTDRQLSIFNYLRVCIIYTNIVSLRSTVAFMQHSRVSMQHSRVSMQHSRVSMQHSHVSLPHSRVLCSRTVFPCSTAVFPCSTTVFHAAQSLIHAAQSLVLAAQPPFHAAEVALTGHRTYTSAFLLSWFSIVNLGKETHGVKKFYNFGEKKQPSDSSMLKIKEDIIVFKHLINRKRFDLKYFSKFTRSICRPSPASTP